MFQTNHSFVAGELAGKFPSASFVPLPFKTHLQQEYYMNQLE